MNGVSESHRAGAVVDAVAPEDHSRLLGYPPAHGLEGPALAVSEASRAWYRRYGRPWTFTREVGIVGIGRVEIELAGGTVLSSRALAGRLRRAGAERLTVVAVSAGGEVDARVADLWRDERPDEAFFLDRFAAAVAEHLAASYGESLCQAGESTRLAPLPGYSPGHDGWDLGQQVEVYGLLTVNGAVLPGRLALLESGMLEPKSSLLTVFGMTPQRQLAAEAWSKSRCCWCSMTECRFRQVPA